MSARAAWRFEQLGFSDVYDYAVGRKDWEAAGLPIEGDDVSGPAVTEAITYDPPTITPTQTVAEARDRAGDESQLIVVNDERVVLGVMRKESWDLEDGRPVVDAMRLGPATVRPGSQLTPLIGRMEKRDVESVLVTDAEGRLIGVVTLESGKAILSGEVEANFETCDSCPGWWRYRLVQN